MWISLSYSGFNAAVYVAGEARQAARSVPRALWLGTLLVTAVYLLLNAIFAYLAPYSAVVGRADVAATVAALFVRRRGEASVLVPVPGYPFTSLLFITATLLFAALAARRNPLELAAAVATIGSGCLLYAILARGRQHARRPAQGGEES